GCDYHRPYRTDILRKRNLMSRGLAFFQFEWPEVFYDRRESVGFAGFSAAQIFVPANLENLVDPSAVGSNYIVINVPCFYAQSFTSVETSPWIRRFESRQIKQAFIDNRNGIGHFPARFFSDFNLILLTWTQYIGHANNRFEYGVLVDDFNRQKSIQSHRSIIDRSRVRLQKRDVRKDIRR